jgi:hypothetical protein
MKAIVLSALFALASGCVVVPGHGKHHHHKGHALSARRDCHPSQYWDGERCRHKGKGHGARKHDD